MEITRICDLIDRYSMLYPEKEDAFATKEGGFWIKVSASAYAAYVHRVACGMLAMGFRPGDRIVSVTNNRPEWNYLDMGMAQAGIIHVPVYPTISNEDFYYILNHAEPAAVFVSDRTLFEKLSPMVSAIPLVKGIFTFDPLPEARHWSEVERAGEAEMESLLPKVEEIKRAIQPNDLATIIYTSGTTGNPKGVMLSHWNIISNVLAIAQYFRFKPDQRALSFLPVSHVFERTVGYFFQYWGVGIWYAEGLGNIADNLREVKPHMFITVPRLLERVFDRIICKGKELSGLRRWIFFHAVSLGLKFDFQQKGSWWYRAMLSIANKIVFSKWREALGGNVEMVVVGGAALQPRLARIYNAARIPVVEGYGMTEASPVIAANRPPVTGDIKIGTVGPALPGVEIKIAADGEILCRGLNVMLGYYKDPEMTSQVITPEGWLQTGDIGTLEEGRYLRITDRKKEIFKLTNGKYVAPQPIENRLKESFFVEQAMVVGENEKFASAIILPNFPYLHNWCARHRVNFRDNRELVSIPQVINRIQREVNEVNRQLGLTEQVKRFRLVIEEWSPVTGELSPSLKLRRRFLADKYKHILNEIYAVQKTNGFL